MIPAREALQRLREGNLRYADENRSSEKQRNEAKQFVFKAVCEETHLHDSQSSL